MGTAVGGEQTGESSGEIELKEEGKLVGSIASVRRL